MTAETFSIVPLGLVILNNGLETDYDVWLNYGRKLYQDYKAIQWAIGDWLNYGEAHYGETYTQALEIFPEHAYQTMANYKYVASRVEFSRRRETLSWSHHAEVAALSPREQTRWLKQADSESWTKAELIGELVKSGVRPAAGKSEAPPLEETLRVIDAELEDAAHHPQAGVVIDLLQTMRDEIAVALERLGDKYVV